MTKFITVNTHEGTACAINVEDISRVLDLGRYPDKCRIILRDGTEIETHKHFPDLMAAITSPTTLSEDQILLLGSRCSLAVSAARRGTAETFDREMGSASFCDLIRSTLK
jgi:hypothetical protein